MSASLKSAAAVSPGATEAGAERPAGLAAGTQMRSVAAAPRPLGRRTGHDPRIYGSMDTDRGIVGAGTYVVSRDNQMSPVEVGATLARILEAVGLAEELESVQMTYIRALYMDYFLNGSSVLRPGRSDIVIRMSNGREGVFSHTHVQTILGENSRRFYRGAANEVRREVQRFMESYNAVTLEDQDTMSMIRSVAADRGMSSYPDLAFDAAIGCTDLTRGEYAAIAKSTNLKVGSTYNAVDSMQANISAQSADRFDSTNGEVVSGMQSHVAGRR